MSNASVNTSRRTLLASGAGVLAAAACASGPLTSEGNGRALAQDYQADPGRRQHSRITTADGTSLYYKDWGKGEVVIFSHGWPLSADSWDSQMLYLAEHGYRCIAHDRRGHGRSSQPWYGNDMDTYAADLATLIDALGLHDVTLVGFSTGGGEVARYVGRYGTRRVARVALISAVTPLMLKTPDNPEGTPIDVFDQLRAQSLADRSKLYRDLASGPFFGFNRAGVTPSQGMIDAFWLQGMQSGHKSAYDCIKAFSETDLSEDLRKIDVPTLIVHGDDDQIVPFAASAGRSSKLVRGATLKVYGGAPHGLPETHKQRLNEDLLSFLQA